MVQTLLTGLPGALPDLKVYHVNLRLSRDAKDIGRWRFGKMAAVLGACCRALALRIRKGPMDLYYVPAPSRRAALYRDWVVMLLCRVFFRRLILHWHGIGLGTWLSTHALAPERWLSRRLLGRADLAIVLAPELVADAQALAPRRIAIVRNGIADPGSQARSVVPSTAPTRILFLGLCAPAKGIFDVLTAIAVANRREAGIFHLIVAGNFADRHDEAAFFSQATALGAGIVRHVGFADEKRKHELFAETDVFCFPTTHPYEGQPLSLIEALAHDLPIITTRWRGIPGMLPTGHVWFVDAGRPDQIADALIASRRSVPNGGERRAHFLAHFTRERHLASLAAAMASVK